MTRGAGSAVKALRSSTPAQSTVNNAKRQCGLLAAVDNIWSPNYTEPSKASILTDEYTLRAATGTMIHRGPDGRHTARGELNHSASANWVMGHQRLAIVDPDSHAADMPFLLTFHPGTDKEKKVKLAANGEIYNHKKLYNKIVAEYGWDQDRISASDCEVIAHACAAMGPEEAVKHLDGMFAFCLFEEGADGKPATAFAARDPVGIKPLYYGNTEDGAWVFASELKALVGHVVPTSVTAIPPGHYWTPQTGLVRYHSPEWNFNEDYAPWETKGNPSADEIREAFKAAISKRMMADVDYGFFLSGGVDSCIVSHALMPMYREVTGDDRPLPAFTVGMEDSPDMMAAKAMIDALGGERYIDHRRRTFTGEEVFGLIPKIVYHMETYEAELIRSAIPNWLLAERAGADVKMVLTGEGSDELFAGYLYFMDAKTPRQIQNELRRIYNMLGDINLHRTDRMTMAHSLEARVPFLDTEFTKLIMSVDPAVKIVDREAVATNSEGREKTFLRKLFEEPNANGDSIPHAVLWRAKAMQCEGVGEDWVSMLQRKVAAEVTDAEMDNAAAMYPLNTPQTKEELYYRRIFEEHYSGMAHVVNPWEGGCRAAGAAWESDSYTREGLANTNVLTHAFQNKSTAAFSTSARTFSSAANTGSKRSFSSVAAYAQSDEAVTDAQAKGYNLFESYLTQGSDDRSMILEPGTNKYHCKPQPIATNEIFRGSCTCNTPTQAGYKAAQKLFDEKLAPQNTQEEVEQALNGIFEDQRQRIASALELPEGVEVALCPSGSDAEYLPIAIARALQPETQKGKKIVNIVTQLKEIGAGTNIAAGGTYFSTHAPLYGKVPEGVTKLNGFGEEGLKEVSINARERSGSVLDASIMAAEVAKKESDSYPILHGVFGGKTGLRDGVMPPSGDAGSTSLGVIDACQGRFSLEELHGWLEQDSIVLFTGSKFYQAPPFCGAIFIPKRIADKLRESPPPEPLNMYGKDALGGFWSDKELPPCMDSWKPLLRREGDATSNNVGLALRWEAGLNGMEALAKTPDTERVEAVDEWAQIVTDLVKSNSAQLDAWCVERSIVSIRLAREDGNGWLSMSELRDVYRFMSLDVSSAVPSASDEEKEALATCCFIGQPVDVSETHAILRIALGAESLTNYLDDPESTLNEDEAAVKKLAVIAKNFTALKNSNI